jgi:signal transduction histidine kinase
MTLSVRTRETLLISVLVAAVGAAMTLAGVVYTASITATQAFDQARAASSQVYFAVQQSLRQRAGVAADPRQTIEGDEALREAIGATVKGSWPVSEAYVADPSGRVLVFVSLDAATQTPPSSPRPDLEALESSNAVSKLVRILTTRDAFEHTSELTVTRAGKSEPLGSLHVAVASKHLLPALMGPILINLLIVLVSLVGAAVVAAVSADIALKPIETISTTIEQLGSGDAGAARAVTQGLPKVAPAMNDPLARATNRLRALGERLAVERSELEMTRGRLRQVMSNLEDRMLLVTPDLSIIAASPHAGPLLGLPPRELTGFRLTDLLPQGHPVVLMAVEALRARNNVEQRSIPIASDNGYRQIFASAQYVEDEGDSPVGALLLLRDAESIRRLEAHVDYAHKLAQLGRITSGVSHEIKNPLNAMAIHLEILKSKLESGAGDPTPQIEVLQSEIARLDRVVKTFLDFTRPVEVRLEPHDLNRIVEQVTRLTVAEAEQRGVQLRVQLAPGPLTVRADADMLTQALLNVAINGCQAMADGGPLRVATSRADGHMWRVEIEDKGVGISPEAREKIFNLYYTTKPSGSGIGLAQAFRAVQIHSGEIRVHSQPDLGTRFEILLPEG